MSFSDPISADGARLREQHDYLRLLSARVTGGGANQMLLVALGWQMYDLTASAWQLGLVGLAQFLPALLLTLPAGHLVDRHDRRLLLAGSLSLQCAVAACLALASAGGWVGPNMILLLSILLGTARALQMPAQQALMPTLVPPSLLARAVAAGSATMQAAIIAGPALGGALYAFGPWLSGMFAQGAAGAGNAGQAGAHWGAAVVYTVAFLLMIAGIWGVLTIRQRPAQRLRPAPGLAEVTAGIRFIWQRPVMLGAMSLDLFAVLLGGATALLPIFARDILHTGPEGLGMLRSAPALGALIVGVTLSRIPITRRVGRKLLAAVAVFGFSMIAFASGPIVLVRFRGAGDQRRGRHVQRRDPPVAGPARNPGRDAGSRERGELGVHRRQQPARRVRIGCHGGTAGAGRLGAAGRSGDAGRRAPVVETLSGARAAGPPAAGRVTGLTRHSRA